MTEKNAAKPSSPTQTTMEKTPAAAESTKTLSGDAWCDSFPGSKDAAALKNPFKAKFLEFLAAMERAGCVVTISSTFRPPERAYLMHFAYQIKNGVVKAANVESMPGVNINWDHGDDIKSVATASEMTKKFGIDHLKVPPDRQSQHTLGFAVDMNITWTDDLEIQQKDGTSKKITSEPRNRMNADLHAVGAGYGIIKFKPLDADKPHWSDTGK